MTANAATRKREWARKHSRFSPQDHSRGGPKTDEPIPDATTFEEWCRETGYNPRTRRYA